jgi:riboflavin synthase
VFTGIVTELGRVQAVRRRAPGAALHVACRTVVEDARVGDSIAVNGVCLTVTELAADGEGFVAEAMGETLARSALGRLAAGDPVNLEPALRADARLGGHLVQGHVDATAEVLAVDAQSGEVEGGADQSWTVLTIALPIAITPYVVEKGSITVDGVSLTVMRVDDTAFAIGLIPHTLGVTTLGTRAVGDLVNLEVDVIAKYVERMLRAGIRTPYASTAATPASIEERA